MSLRKLHAREAKAGHLKRQGPLLPLPSTTTTTTSEPVTTTTTTSTSTSETSTSTSSSSSSSQSESSRTLISVSSSSSASSSSATSTSRSTTESIQQFTVTRTSTTRTSASSLPTETTVPDEGLSTASIAGVVAAAVFGVVVFGAFMFWLLRRRKGNSDFDDEPAPFNRDSFLRHSTMIPDDDSGLPPRRRAEMSERALSPTPTYGGSNYSAAPQQNAFGYSTQPYQPGQVVFSPNEATFGPGGVPASALPQSPAYGYGQPYDNGMGLQRQPSDPHGYADLQRGGPDPFNPYQPQQYGEMSPQVDSPYQTTAPLVPAYAKDSSLDQQPRTNTPPSAEIYTPAKYPELSPAVAEAQQGRVVTVPQSAYNGRETPVQLGFAAPQTKTNAKPGPGGRPDSVFDPEDAYGGI